MSIKILLADDHKLLREGLRELIEEQPDMTVIGEADNGNSALRLVEEKAPDVVVMDISMPGLNGIEATHRIMAAVPGTKILALSMHDEARFVTEMFGAGACGYLLKDCVFDELILAIHTVAEREKYLSHRIDTAVKDRVFSGGPKAGSCAMTISPTGNGKNPCFRP